METAIQIILWVIAALFATAILIKITGHGGTFDPLETVGDIIKSLIYNIIMMLGAIIGAAIGLVIDIA